MRFMMLVRATDDSEAEVLPSSGLIAEMGRFNEQVELRQVFEAEDFGEAAHPLPERFEGERRIQHAAANGAAAPS